MSGNSDDCDYTLSGGHVRIHRARKEHRCSACKGPVRPGDRYAYQSFVSSENGVEAFKRCMRCEYIYRTLCVDLAAGRLDGDFVEPDLGCGHAYEDTHSAPMPDHLARVAFMTIDEIQGLSFDALDREREAIQLRRELKSSRRIELEYRLLDHTMTNLKETHLEWAARQNARTCEIERKLEALT